ncbi:LysR family transcriptional regulator [Profundibacter sp.]|uniref:LysR family transcriptional regulator n=1 Tax=Profundibacter sp. TaxID=3101071 RepID=UPI003D12E5B5
MDMITGMRTFVATVETGSFTAAADRVGISNKLASKYIAQLEDHLSVRLLHRTTRTLSLTDAGQRYYPRCARLLEDFDALEGSVRDDNKALKGILRLAAPTTFGELYVQPLVRQFRQQHPDLAIELRLSDRFIDLADEGFDLAIRIGALEDSSLIARKLAVTELWAVASPDYLAAKTPPETPRHLNDYQCIQDTNLRSGGAWPFLINGQMQKIAVNGGYMVNSALAVRDLVIAGEGIGLCPDYVVTRDVAAGNLERVLADYPSSSLDIHSVYLDARYMPAKVRGFLDFLAGRFKGLTDWQSLRK